MMAMQQPEDTVLVMTLGKLNDIKSELYQGKWVRAFELLKEAEEYIRASRETIAKNWTDEDRIQKMQGLKRGGPE